MLVRPSLANPSSISRLWAGRLLATRLRVTKHAEAAVTGNSLPEAHCLEADPAFQTGLAYLYQVRSLAPDPDLIVLMQDPQHRVPVCTWVGSQIAAINARLQLCLQHCQDCFHSWQQRPVQIFAAPLSPPFGLDGLCNLQTQPVTILVDVGRVVTEDWLALVAHEYAHAHLGSAGHQADFRAVLTHLCLGLGLALPSPLPTREADWRMLPTYRSSAQPLNFWLGESGEPV
jgi:hypothetical protein